MSSDPDCVFCDIVHGKADAKIVHWWPRTIAFEPLNPVTPGHVLVVPLQHVRDATEDVDVTARTMAAAAGFAQSVGPCNLLTSIGAEATQSVFHLHIHVVPRRAGDGLKLPWTDQ